MMKLILGMASVVFAMTMSAIGETTNTVKVTKFHQSYPYLGKATIEYTVGGTLPANAVAKIAFNTGDASATFTQEGVVAGVNSNVIDFALSFGGAMLLTNASFVVTIELGGVQLWENGPYWAECNVGASKPEEDGYYFWWGDTVGYSRSGGTRNGDYYTDVTWVSSAGEQMSSSPFTSSCPTYNINNLALRSAGYLGPTSTAMTGNLVAGHDAATAHIGSPWRMPTDAEFSDLISNCTTTWTTINGVKGRLVKGKGDYANRSIFFPAAGYGYGSRFCYADSTGAYWSSTPMFNNYHYAFGLYVNSSSFGQNNYGREHALPVRSVREGHCAVAVGIVTYDPLPDPMSPEAYTRTTDIPVPYAWLLANWSDTVEKYDSYEAAAAMTAANGCRTVGECYALGIDPEDPDDDFKVTHFEMKDGKPVITLNHTEDGSGNSFLPRVKTLGKSNLSDAEWREVPEEGDDTMRFFKVEVEMP